jgi:hypothetical protein
VFIGAQRPAAGSLRAHRGFNPEVLPGSLALLADPSLSGGNDWSSTLLVCALLLPRYKRDNA